MRKGTDNNKKQDKRTTNPGRKGQGPTPGSWKPGQSGNPAGAPKRGHSWAELFNSVGDMTGPEAAARSLVLAQQLMQLGDGITLKEAVAVSAYRLLIFDTSPSLLGQVMDRTDGKPTQPIEWRDQIRRMGIDPDKFVQKFRDFLEREAVTLALDAQHGEENNGE